MIDGWTTILLILMLTNGIIGIHKDDFSGMAHLAIAAVCAGCVVSRVFG